MSGDATGPQLRAARNALGWSIERLARESEVSVRTIIRYEEAGGVPATRAGNLEKLMVVMRRAGIEFIGTPDDGPGIRLWGSKTEDGGS